MITPRKFHIGDSGSHEWKALVDGKEVPRVVYADADQGYVARYASVHDFTPEELATLAKVGVRPDANGQYIRYPSYLCVEVVLRGNVEIVKREDVP